MKEERKSYMMSNAELCMLASNLVVFMNRDAAEFEARGVSAQDITDFHALGDAFERFPPDNYYSADVSIEVESKNNSRKTASKMVKSISGFFEQQWGTADFRYKQLNIKGFHDMTDSKFITTARNVVSVAEDYLADLTPIGLTQADIDNLAAEADSMENKMKGIGDKKAVRESKTKERTQKGNELYSYVKKYSTIGKLIWEHVSEAKYNDYLTYHNWRKKAKKPGAANGEKGASDSVNPKGQ